MTDEQKQRAEWKDDLQEVALQWCVLLFIPLIPIFEAADKFLCRRGLHRPWILKPSGIVACRECGKEFTNDQSLTPSL